ncbi:hypothetical protein [Actinoalloteichus sp. GBA129-24]|uniref:hypothetical protein n=1 Tax=Actinoalloteichus sp. GBA129-24 TaxID=1612551 RepID=UPI0009509278|nr:hypothetical protein [Actinoalloteichus sp. GBA129-24]APU20893.1 hypothetical protein UA75_14415 [Actinoalloteichus sp. GBA129-24]APU24142.1 hypothetical protein UA75_30895 [Actinoalloteichus sp. GBA129-24]
MSAPYEPLSPVDIERKLRACVNDLARAERSLRVARDVETMAELDYRSVHRRAMLSPDAPRVTRGGTTTAERDAWVDDRASEEYRAYRLAQTGREAAQDHLRTVRDVAATVQSLGALVRQAYAMAGAA